MIYDILLIDDDFGTSDEEDNEVVDWNIKNKGEEYPHAKNLLNQFIRKNYRVTYTTGEQVDLDKLHDKDLSVIKFIFCDLNLESDINFEYKQKNSKIIGILNKINKHCLQEEFFLFINSKYHRELDYGNEGIKDLTSSLEKQFKQKIDVILLNDKNELLEEHDKILIKSSIYSYQKSLIIDKAIEIDKSIDKKLLFDEVFAHRFHFDQKIQALRDKFKLKKTSLGSQLEQLRLLRNKLAHMSSLSEIFNQEFIQTFKSVTKIELDNSGFVTLEDLSCYIKSLDDLKTKIESL